MNPIRLPACIIATALLAPAVCAAEPAGPTPIEAGSLLRMVIGLAIVLIAIFAIAWSLRRWGRLRSSACGELQIIGGLAMGPRERLVLVRVGDEQLLLGVAPGRIQTLHRLERPISVQGKPDTAENFSDRLRAALGQGQRP